MSAHEHGPKPAAKAAPSDLRGQAMRRIVVVALLLLMMTFLGKAEEAPTGGASDPMTLAAIGFVILAAFAVAELLAQVGLPKVTGYILSGIVLGPFVGNVLSTPVVEQMGMFKTLAVGLIALTAGLELELEALKKLLRTLLATVGAKVLIAAPLVGGALIAIELALHPLGMSSSGHAIAIGLVFGALSIGTSPAIALAVVSESGAKGRLSELVLGAAVLKDLVVVIALAIAVAMANSQLGEAEEPARDAVAEHAQPEGAAHGEGELAHAEGEAGHGEAEAEHADAGHAEGEGDAAHAEAEQAEGGHEGEHAEHPSVAHELIGAVIAGVFLGYILIAYMAWIKAEMLLFVAAMVLVGAEVAKAFHVELLLLFIVAGFVVRNRSKYGHDLHHPLEMVSLPVFVVFFTTAGAAIDVNATLQVLPVAIALVAVRAGGFWLSSLIGNRVGDEDAAVAQNAWFSYLPQAGVTLGLVDIAAGKLPAIGAEIRAVGMAFVALNLLGGPLALRAGLARAGELPEGGDEDEVEGGPRADEPAIPRLVPLEPLSERLEAYRDGLRTRVEGELESNLAKVVRDWVELRRRAFAALLAGDEARSEKEKIAQLVALAEAPPRSDATSLANSLAALFERSANYSQRLDITAHVPLEARWLEPPEEGASESLRVGLRRGLRRLAVGLGSRRAKTRELPLRLIAREAYEPRLATAILELFRASCRAEARLADAIRRRLEGRLSSEALGDTLELVLVGFEDEVQAIQVSTLEASSRRMHLLLARIDSPAMPIDSLDFSEAAQGIERELNALLEEAERWPTVIDACWQFVEVSARIRRIDDRITSGRDGAIALAEARVALDEVLASFARRLEPLVEQLQQGGEGPDEEALDAFSTHARALLPKPAGKRLRQVEGKLRKLSEGRSVHQALREAAARDTGSKLLVGPELVVAATVPSQVRPRELDVRELIDGEVAARLLPAAQQILTEGARVLGEAHQSAAAMVSDIELLADLYRRDATLANFRAGLERVQQRAATLREESLRDIDAATGELASEFEDLGDRLADSLHTATATSGDPSTWVARRTGRARREVGRELSRIFEAFAGVWTRVSGRLMALAEVWTSDYRLRAGLSLPSAAAIAKLIESDNKTALGGDYTALFDPAPIRDPRFFITNRERLKALTRAERAWHQQRSAANAVLVVGGPGSGKTSLLNVASLKLSTRHVLWLPPRRGSVLSSLAAELGCPVEHEAISSRLLDHPRVVIIDDLERLLPVDGGALSELEALTTIIAETASSCFWVVAAGNELQRLLARNWPLRVGFSELLELGRLDAEALAQLITARHRISALELSFQLSPLRRVLALARVREREQQGAQRNYFNMLARRSEGNIRAAMVEWCRAGAVAEGEQLELGYELRGRSLPFVRQLPSTALAILATCLRYRALTRGELAGALLRERTELERFIHFLLTATLLESDDQGLLSCPARVRDVLEPELRELGVLHKEGS